MMKKYVFSRNFIERKVTECGYDAKSLFFPCGSDFLIFKTFERFEEDDKYFILDKYSLSLKMVSKDVYLSYINKINNFHYNTILMLSRALRYTIRPRNRRLFSSK